MKRFAIIGAAGYIAPRHMKAIKDTGNDLIAAFDPYDGIGIIDSYFPNADFFTEFERFDRYIDKLKREGNPIDIICICSPNYLHDAHIRFALKSGCDVICEKPLVLNPWNLKALIEVEKETQKKVFTILQLRLHPNIIALREKVLHSPKEKVFEVDLKYISSRGKWYHRSWKGDISKSGGIATNIGVHFFDILTWIFGGTIENKVTIHNQDTAAGFLHLEKAKINWFLSIDYNQVPEDVKLQGKRTYRILHMDGEEVDFSDGFNELHTESYKQILAGDGYSISMSKDVLDIVHSIRSKDIIKNFKKN